MPVDHDGLEEMYDAIRADRKFAHLRTPGIKLVPGIGSDEPLALVVGEAPGAAENREGEPFCGTSGKVLSQLMDMAGLYARKRLIWRSESDVDGISVEPNVWLTNTVKFRPPGNRTPNIAEILAAREYLRREWSLIGKPRLIVCVGSVAADALGAHEAKRMIKGDLYRLRGGKGNTYIAYQYHPAFGLRQGKPMQDRIEEQWDHMGDQIAQLREELGWPALERASR